MQSDLREHLNTEITRKQFLQYMAGAALMVFGLSNLISLFQGTRTIERRVLVGTPGADGHSGFGTRRFGV